ncbi:MAG: site-2 protease family protein, partial [Deltaproteobacteria bacterium]|nr:site-2 protease family protein [Deltaproteobacteria bacterium]
LPVVVFTALMFAGEPQPIADVGRVEREAAAWNAGLRPGDRIVEVNGQPVLTWVDVIDAFADDEADPVQIVVEREEARLPMTLGAADVDLPLSPWDYGFDNDAPDTTLVVDDPASPAARAGLRTGDQITQIDGAAVRSFFEVERALSRAEKVRVRASRGEETVEVEVAAEPGWAPSPAVVDDDTYRRYGLASATLSVASFADDAAAEKAGVRVGDRLLRVAGRDVYAWTDVVRAVADSKEGEGEAQAARPVELVLRRDGTVTTIVATPDVQEVTDDLGRYRIRPMLGIGGGGAWIAAPEVPREYPLPQAFLRGANETYLLGSFVVKQVGLLVTGGASVQKSLGGPPEIFRQAMAAAERGVFDYARLMGQLSISLGVLNLLPVPVLDGGQIVMYAAELVRGRPLPVRLRERLQQVGVVFLLTLLMFVLVFDIHRWITES